MSHPEPVRHVASIFLASIFAPAIFLLTGVGLNAIDPARRSSFTENPFGALGARGALFLAGLMYGGLVVVRMSPVGPRLSDRTRMSACAWAGRDPASYYPAFGVDVHQGGAAGQVGLGMLLGVPLVATLTRPRRWRSEENGHADVAEPVANDV